MHESTARYRVVCMGRRSGKSWMAAHEILPWLLTPNTRGWIVAPNYNLGQKVAREVKRVIMTQLKLPIESKKEISGDLYFMRLAGLNSELSVKSADAPDSLIGEGIDYLVMDEAALIPKNTYEMYLRPTLADRKGWALFTSTPRGFNHFESWFRYGQDKKYPEWDSWQVPSWDSPYFKDDIEELKRTLTHETFLQELGSEFTSFAGKVYPFDRTTQIQKNLKYNPALPTYIGIDFGYRHSFAIVVQCDTSGPGLPTVYQIDEVSMKNVKTEDFAKVVSQLPYHITAYYGDPAGIGTNMQTGMSDFQVFHKQFGIRIHSRRDKLSRDIPNRVSHVRRWFEDANGEPHFFVAARCKESIQSYENYRYPTHKEDQALKEVPLKDGRFDHCCDALAYFFVNYSPIKSNKAGTIDWL